MPEQKPLNYKALTICQPYAHLICNGEKRFENRTWWTGYRGWLVIHAGKSRDWLETWSPLPNGMIFGAVIGIARLVNCVEKERLAPTSEYLRDPHCEGPMLWCLQEARFIPEPIPWRGEQGLWDAGPELVKQIRGQLARVTG